MYRFCELFLPVSNIPTKYLAKTDERVENMFKIFVFILISLDLFDIK